MSRVLDLSGQRFGRLTVIGRAESDERGKARWLCKCDCGNIGVKRSEELRRGKTKSCGCLNRELVSKRATIHGQKDSRLYRIWANMKNRCTNHNSPVFNDYGGRGITICEEWKNSFIAFRDWALANGYAVNLTIDRIDNDGGYNPKNCRWVDLFEQANNKRNNRYLAFEGETHTVPEWAAIKGINKSTIKTRIGRGWSIERALTEPVNKGR